MIAAATGTCIACGKAVEGRSCSCGTPLIAGRFRIVSLISQNGHSQVYRAVDPDGTVVALKELAFAFAPDARTIDIFEREAALLRSLTIPGIPRFVDAFQEGVGSGLRLYLAQELIEGEPLNELLKRGPVAPDEVTRIGREVLQTLGRLHTHDPPIFHRDIKPANLIRRLDGSIALVDLGAARESRAGGTHGATLVGTFGYMPPEQLGGTVDETSDLYGLGATLLHLATGRAPESFVRGEDQWRGLDLPRETLPPPLREFLARLLAPNKAQRFLSVDAALLALDAPPIQLEPPVGQRSAAMVFLAAVAALLMGGAYAVLRPLLRTQVVVSAPTPQVEVEPVAAPAEGHSTPTEKLPTIGISVAEQLDPKDSAPLRVVETELIERWLKVGFRFVTLSAGQTVRFPAETDVVLVGTAIVVDQGNLSELLGDSSAKMPIRSCRGALSIRALQGDSGRILATVQVSKISLNISPLTCGVDALKKAADEASDELQQKMLDNWKSAMRASK